MSIASAAAWSQPLGSNKQQDIAATSASPDIDEISSTANPIPRPFYTKGANLPRNGEPTVSPPTFGSDSQPTPTLLPALLGGVTLAEPPPPVESALIQTDHISHAFRSPSPSLPTPESHIALQSTSVLDAHVATSIETLLVHGNTRDLNLPLPMDVSRRIHLTTPSCPDIAEAALATDDGQHGQN